MLNSLGSTNLGGSLRLGFSVCFVDSLSLGSLVWFRVTRFVGRFNIFITLVIGTFSMLGLITYGSSNDLGFRSLGAFSAPKWEHQPGTKVRLSDFMSRTTLCRLSQGFPRMMRCCPNGVISIGAVNSE